MLWWTLYKIKFTDDLKYSAFEHINKLRKYDPKRILWPLEDILLFNKKREVRARVVDIMGALGHKEFVEPLVKALKTKSKYRQVSYDDNIWVRTSAARALGKIGDVRAVEPLITVLKDQSSCWTIVDKDSIPLYGTAQAGRSDYPVPTREREAVAEALGEIGNEQAIKALFEALKEKIVKTGDHKTDDVISQDQGFLQRAAFIALCKVGDVHLFEQILSVYKEDSRSVSTYYVEAFNELVERVLTKLDLEILKKLPDVEYYKQDESLLKELVRKELKRRGV